MKESFGQLAGMCPSSIYRCFRMGNHRLKCVKHPFYSHFRAAQGAFPSVPWSNQPNRIYPHPSAYGRRPSASAWRHSMMSSVQIV